MRLLALLIFLAAARGQVTFRAPVRLVTAPTLVFSEDGNLIPDLKASDFRLYDNDRPRKITVEPASAPLSVAVAVQTSLDVRAYLPFIAKVGSVVESLLVGEGGESALVVYNAEVKTLKPFESGDLQDSLRRLFAEGSRARAIDAGMMAVRLLRDRPPAHSRVLLFIGQPLDDGSESKLDVLKEEAARENITVIALTLPQIGKSFVSDTFSLQGPASNQERGGFKAGVDLLKLITALNRTADAAGEVDPFHSLAAATAGAVFRFRKQNELEGALAAVGVQLRSAYLLSFYANGEEPGPHTIKVEVNVPGARVQTRRGY